MRLADLAQHDGREGRKAYVAVAQVIYDVSASSRWVDGNHLDTHQAGADLTEELKGAPHVRSLIERFPVVGRLEETPSQKKSIKARWLIPLVVIIVLGAFFWLR